MSETIEARARALELNTERGRAWNEGQALLDEINQRADKTWSAEDHEKWNRVNAEVDRLDAERDVYLKAEQRQQEAETIRAAELSDFGERNVTARDYNERTAIAEAIRDIASKPAGGTAPVLSIDVTRAAHERQMIRDGIPASEARALAWDTGSVASAVPVTTARRLYEYLEASIALFRMPTTKVQTGSGEQMKFPRLAAHAIATQVSGQGTLLAGTDPTFASMVLDAFKYGELVIVASEVLTDAVFDVGAFLARDIGRALGRKIDTDLTVGGGSGAPNGVVTAAVGSVTTGGTEITPTYENLVDMVYGVNDAYRAGGDAAWLMRDATAGIVRKIRDGAGGTLGAAMWQPSQTVGIAGGVPDMLLNFPVYTDPNVASCASNAKVALFGDFSAYYIRTVGSIDIARDDSRYFDTDQVGFRGKWRVDGDSIDTNAFKVLIQKVS